MVEVESATTYLPLTSHIAGALSHGPDGLTLPLQNAPKKRMVFSNTILCSKKDLGSSFSKNVWPFE